MSKVHGNGDVVLVSSEQQFDPQQGFVTVLTYRGSPEKLLIAKNNYEILKWKTCLRTNNTQWPELVVSQPDSNGGQTGGEVPQDRYNIKTEYAQADIWSSPKLIDYLRTTLTMTDDQIYEQKAKIEKANEQRKTPAEAASSGIALSLIELYKQVRSGLVAFEYGHPVLSRVRTFSTAYSSPMIVEKVPKVYGTDALISTFNLPSSVVTQIGVNPTFDPPNGTTWGWKQRQNDSEIVPALNKIQETLSWTFAAWSNYGHEIVI